MLKQNKWVMLFTVALFTLMATMDGSIINIAMPVLAKELNVDMNKAEWIVSVYILTIVVFLLFFGRLGDILGRIKIFRIGTFIFMLGSLACGLSESLEILILCKFFQAIGASMTMSTNFAIISETFTGKDKGTAMGVLASFVSLGNIAGPVLGGILLSTLSWHFIFFMNVPVGLLAVILGFIVFPKEEIKKQDQKLDLIGFLLQAIAIISFFVAIFYYQEAGMNSIIIVLFIVAIIFLFFFIQFEKRAKQPLLDLRIFKNKRFSSAITSTFLVYAAMFFFSIIMPFYLQKTLGFPPFQASIFMMGAPIAMVVVAPISGYLSGKYGSNKLTFIGLLLLCIIQLFLITLNENSNDIYIFSLSLLTGVGIGMFQSPNNVLVMSSPDPEHLGAAGSLNSFARNLGNIVGISLATSALFISMSFFAGYSVTTYIEDKPDLFIDGMHMAFIGSFILYGIAMVITLVRLINDRKKEHNA